MEAIAKCTFPFDDLLPGIQRETGGRTFVPIEWRDLSRFSAEPVLAAREQEEHNHVHDKDGTAHPIEREIDGRKRVLGLAYYPPTLKVVVHSGLANDRDRDLAIEVLLAEFAHIVDFVYLTNEHRRAIVNILHRDQLPEGYVVRDGVALGLDGHVCSWFDVGAYRDWVGEAFMEGFIEAFSNMHATLTLRHPVNADQANAIRWAILGPEKLPEVIFVGTASGKAFHRPKCPFIRPSWVVTASGWTSVEHAVSTGRRPCRVCRPR